MKNIRSLKDHFQNSFKRPLPTKWMKPCEEVIQTAKTGNFHKEIEFDPGLFRTVGEMIEMFELEDFIDWDKASFSETKDMETRKAVPQFVFSERKRGKSRRSDMLISNASIFDN